jgi:calcineurin-like phosphoesterase family protein
MTKQTYRISRGLELTQPKHRPKQTIFTVSDLHLNHRNIIRYCNRPFSTENVNEMNEVLINNWNHVVKPEDTVFFVGDMALGSSDKYIPKLNGNIFFISGNHDRSSDKNSMHESLYFTYKGKTFLFIHDPKYAPKDFEGWIIHGHHHNNYPDEFPFFDPERKRVNVSVELVRYQPVLFNYINSLINEEHEKIVHL